MSQTTSEQYPIFERENTDKPIAGGLLKDLVVKLREIFESDDINVEEVKILIESYKSNPADWEKFAQFDPHRYTRNLVDEGNGKYDLLLVCWEGGHYSGVHDHADSHCFMKSLQGDLSEIRFAWPEAGNDKMGELQETSQISIPLNRVSYMSDSLGLHLLKNASLTERAVTLHLYSPPFSACSLFDQKTGHPTKTRVIFWSKYGKKVNVS